MKKSFFVLFLLLALSILITVVFLFIDFKKSKKIIYSTAIHNFIKENNDISNNYKKYFLSLIPKDKDWYDFLKKHPNIQKEIQNALSLIVSEDRKYVYLLGKKKDKFVFLADGSKEDKAEFGEIFEPLNKSKFNTLKPTYFFHKRLKNLFLTYIYPIVINNKLKGILVIDISLKFSEFIKGILENLSKSINFILLFSVILIILLISFAFLDFKREKEKEMLLKKLKEVNKSLEKKVKEKINEIREKDLVILNQSKLASMGEMLNMIAHQWRQPLNTLSGYAIRIEMENEIGEVSKEECLKFSKFVQKSTQDLSEIINDFMNYSKKEDEKKEVFVEDIIKDTLKLIEPQLRSHGIELKLDIDNIKIKTYKKDVIHILLNLIANSRDALDENKKENKLIKISVKKEDKTVKFIVEDNAGGIPEEIKDRIFEPYFTTKVLNKGTGIGLYMSRKIAHEKLNGKLYFENTLNGAKFILEVS